ncbi:pentatricopeptide repeat-containing protein At2g33680-like [Diospyros lotus]|uniref:pentatricopeptide repeat-containing protein At2g33680-like n=1 Tax=Diospyros lotus TaxID=55363 RepID=UPI0022541863|nr:pentatricopeptide repeat-containing protein At2g33680-like [Diospyros lotus]XP_052173279.1 pentatricopeptide repeat-containing protein At2g33680-like [Diospyros lotus]XP_052173280.1 pentatricopeptide repeat-containing protein At2g33680-like [Diospyros lotus]XP_052173282.1 pentatricopeptide repeat-containing protein At2g33680-like [Diospyros lotus]
MYALSAPASFSFLSTNQQYFPPRKPRQLNDVCVPSTEFILNNKNPKCKPVGYGVSLCEPSMFLNEDWPQLLRISIGSEDFCLGQAIHGFLTKSGYRNDVFRGNNLVNLYVKFNSVDDAQRVFDEMLDRNTITWTSLINGYSQINDVNSVVRLAHCMHKSDQEFNEHTCSVILRACEFPDKRGCGKQIHSFIIKSGFCEDVYVGTSLVSMYSRSGRLDDAEKQFNELTCVDVCCLNFMISEYGNAGYGKKALHLFLELLQIGLEPNDYTFTNVISACDGVVGSEEGRMLHGLAIKYGLVGKTSVGNSIITMYGRYGLVEEAKSMFHCMGERNLVSWTALLSIYVANGHGQLALAAFLDMVSQGLNLDSDCLACVLNCCSESKNLNMGLQIHGFVIKLGMPSNVYVGTALIDLYAKCENLKSARLLLNGLSVINSASFNAFLVGCTKNDGEEDVETMLLFNQLRLAGLKPDSVTLASLLSLSAEQACLVKGTSLHAYAVKTGFDANLTVSNAIITMYAKCGSISDACQMFMGMKKLDLISWNAIIFAHAIHGQGKEALSLFNDMVIEGFSPDKITVLAVLQACCYSGFWNYGLCLFNELELKYGIRPALEHFACLVNLLGRAGLFVEAKDLINRSPFSDSPLLWRTLVHVCKIGGNLDFGKMASNCLLNLAPKEAGSYILVSNMYAGEGMFDEAARVRTEMNDLKIRKEAGCSWIEIDNKTHLFVASSRNHPESRDIYEKLDLLRAEIEQNDDKTDLQLIWDPA